MAQNYLEGVGELRHRYFIQRHGLSVPNVDEIIVSKPENGTKEAYGLVELGQMQAARSAIDLYKKEILGPETIIISSDFSRADETARISQVSLGVETPIFYSKKLRERNFGLLELGINKNYTIIWGHDAKDPTHTIFQVENVDSVAKRTSKLIRTLEKSTELKNGMTILFVTHGDTGQIMQAIFEGINVSEHRTLPPLQNGEIRELVRSA